MFCHARFFMYGRIREGVGQDQPPAQSRDQPENQGIIS
jgi:hypothetical protein